MSTGHGHQRRPRLELLQREAAPSAEALAASRGSSSATGWLAQALSRFHGLVTSEVFVFPRSSVYGSPALPPLSWGFTTVRGL